MFVWLWEGLSYVRRSVTEKGYEGSLASIC